MKKIILYLSFLFLSNIMVSQTTAPDEDPIFTDVEIMPQFPGGVDSMKAFVHRNIHYPEELKLVNFKGAPYVNLLVTKTGKLKDVKIMQSCGYVKMDKEALRLISIMPNWVPGKDNGKAVNVAYYFSIELSQ